MLTTLMLLTSPAQAEEVEAPPAAAAEAPVQYELLDEPDVQGVLMEPGLRTETLDSGLRVSVLSDYDMPIVATQVWVQVGSAHEAPAEAGFAHLFEHLMFGATAAHDKEAYSRHHTMNGGSENAYTSFDNTVYISEIAPQAHDQVLVLEADRAANLILDQDNLDNEKKIVTEELRLRMENNPVSRLLTPALGALFGEHPYNHTPAGTKEDVQGADLALVKKFYDGYYHPANLHLVVVGPVSGDAVIARADELFGATSKQRLEPPAVPELSSWPIPEQITLTEDLPPIKVAGRVTFGPTRRDSDYWAYRLMTEMLAGGELDRFREDLVGQRSKAVEAVSVAEELRAGGVLAFASVSLPFRGKRRAFKLIEQSLANLDEGDWLSQEVLETARRRLLKQELERSYYADQMADALGQAYAWQGDETLAMGGASEAIDAVTLEQVQAAWSTYVMQAQPVQLWVKKGKTQDVGGEL